MIERIADGKVWTAIAVAMVVSTVIGFVYCKRRCRLQKNPPIPTLLTKQVVLYIMFLKNIFFQKHALIPPLCLLHQVLCAACHVFDEKRILRFWLLGRPIVFFYKPETVEVLMSSSTTIDKANEYRFLQPWLGTGLLTSNGDKWRRRRKFLTPTFHFKILEDFIPVFDEQSSILVKNLRYLSREPWIDIVPVMTSCTIDILCQTAMGVHMDVQGGGSKDYVQAIHEIGEAVLDRVCRPWMWNDTIFFCLPIGRKFKRNLQKVHGFTRKVIKEKKEFMMRGGGKIMEDENMNDSPSHVKRRRAFLELLLEKHFADESFTEEDIREEVDTFMFEGHDTTSCCISFALYLLGLHQDVQEQVHKELDDSFLEDDNRSVTPDDIRQMKYLECVIKETLRLYPPVPFSGRELKEDINVLKYKVPAGTLCFIFSFMLHRDSGSFPNPEKFDPDRFLPQNSLERHPYSYVPFAAGPRNCIGQKFAMTQIKTVLANILRKFQVVSLDHRDKINLLPELILRSVEPLRVKFITRR